MLLTILIAALAACGPLMILLALKDAFLPRPRRSCHVIYLDPAKWTRRRWRRPAYGGGAAVR